MKPIKLRVGKNMIEIIERTIFNRYPDKEWGTLFRFGYHTTTNGRLLLTVSSIVEPTAGDLNEEVENVQFLEHYLLKAALASGDSKLGVGAIHSHPEGFGVRPSRVDDDMDSYLRDYFGAFAPDRPYASLIFSRNAGRQLSISGRAWWKGCWHPIESFIVGTTLQRYPVFGSMRPVPEMVTRRLERLTNAVGELAAIRLWNSSAVVVGVGGTGSAAAHSLARSCIGRIVLIDGDLIAPSNSERVHGCEQVHLNQEVRPSKVEILRDLIRRINPDIEVVTIQGNALQAGVFEELIYADIVLGCTDTNHGRGGLSELAYRYLTPALQVNVVLETDPGILTGQIVQFTRYRPGRPCAYCLDQIDTRRMAQELMSPAEKERRMASAAAAIERGEPADPYWRDEPIVPTVGALTTLAGELAANFAVGMLTEKFSAPSDFIEMNLLAPDFGVTSVNLECTETCTCVVEQGHADQSPRGRLHLPPAHWPEPRWL